MGAAGNPAAHPLAMADEEGVILIEESFILRQVLSEERLKGLVAIRFSGEVKAAEDAPGIGIDDEDRPPRSVEDYGVRGLRANAVDREELLAKGSGIKGKESAQVAAVTGVEPLGEGFEL